MIVSGPFIEYDCSMCGCRVQRKISMRKVKETLDEFRERKYAFCAGCHRGTDELTIQAMKETPNDQE